MSCVSRGQSDASKGIPPPSVQRILHSAWIAPLPVALNLLAIPTRLCHVSGSDYRVVLSRVSAKLVYVIAIPSSPFVQQLKTDYYLFVFLDVVQLAVTESTNEGKQLCSTEKLR